MALAHVLVLDHLSGTNGGAVAREDFCLQVLLATRVMSERSCDHDASTMHGKLMLMCMYERLYSLYTVQYTWRACVICREQQSE